MECNIKVIGFILVTLGLVHIIFPKYFNWQKELKLLSTINREMMIVHTFFIALTVFLMGVLCLTCAPDLMETNLGRKISFGLGVFWLARLIAQFFGYSSQLWKGKAFETIIHVLFSLTWTYLSLVFFLVCFQS
jgi:hypothetical protein